MHARTQSEFTHSIYTPSPILLDAVDDAVQFILRDDGCSMDLFVLIGFMVLCRGCHAARAPNPSRRLVLSGPSTMAFLV